MKYESLSKILNSEAIKILLLIKEDYYEVMNGRKRKILSDLLNSKEIVIVNNGKYINNETILAHGGRALKDGKIHFYPDSRKFKTEEAMIEKCKGILPHEIFHYFLQPDRMKFEKKIEKEVACFYTEGLVEREARRFSKKHSEITFNRAFYDYNIDFVNKIENSLRAGNYKTIFGEEKYLKNIGKYVELYNIVPEEYKIKYRKKEKKQNKEAKDFEER